MNSRSLSIMSVHKLSAIIDGAIHFESIEFRYRFTNNKRFTKPRENFTETSLILHWETKTCFSGKGSRYVRVRVRTCGAGARGREHAHMHALKHEW